MKTRLVVTPVAGLETECLAIIVLDESGANGNGSAKPAPKVQAAEAAVQAAVREVLEAGEIGGRMLETALLHHPQGLKAKRLLLIGGGKAANFSAYELRRAAGAAVRLLKAKNLRSFAFLLPPLAGGAAEAAKAVTEGAFVGNFDPDTYKSDRKDQKIDELTLVAPGADEVAAAAMREATIVGESQNAARELINEPSNRLTPAMLGERTEKIAAEVGLACEVYGPEKMRELKMGAFLSVAQGSDEEPRLIVLRYEPAGALEKPCIGLVGKGITFDSGGISLKPGDGMEKMKYDMAGAAAMIGAMRAIALLRPPVRVLAVLCVTENMPSGKAQKPGDVQIAMSGKSIEVINTDAEGRLVLADGLHWARQLGATHLIDAATLTGACVVALGFINVGLFASDEAMYGRFAEAERRAGEKMWRLPLDAEYQEQIRSNIADIQNTGGRWGGAVTAAMFLKEFVGDTPWIHLDIAGTAWMEDNKPWIAKGPSGVTIRTIVEYVREMAKS
jgi:leucyl aminopeptidase